MIPTSANIVVAVMELEYRRLALQAHARLTLGSPWA